MVFFRQPLDILVFFDIHYPVFQKRRKKHHCGMWFHENAVSQQYLFNEEETISTHLYQNLF